MNIQTNDTLAGITTYFAAAVGYLQDVEWTTLGAAVLLIARLTIDVPRAIEVVIYYWKKRNDKNDSNR